MAATALVLESPLRLVASSIELPRIRSDDGLLRVEACGLCGTDHEQFTGVMNPGYAFIPGHETVGVIEAIGEEAAQRWGVTVGDRVAVEVFQSCGTCAQCATGHRRLCVRHGIRDMYGFIPVAKPPGLWGGYADIHYLGPDSMLLPVPEGLDPVTATLFNPLGAGIRWGATLPGTKKDDIVAVLGPGIRGLSAVAAAKTAGAGFVMITGSGHRDSDRLALSRRFGSDLAVDVTERDPVAALKEATGRLADVVVDVTAKAPAAFAQAMNLARPGGTVVVAGTRGTPETPGFSPDLVVFKELRILGALGVDVSEHEEALRLLASGAYPFDEIPRSCAGFGEVAGLLTKMAGESSQEEFEQRPVHGVFVPR
ncbi:MAG TPA: medium chain dehydrogenase/reductase family protein [Acidimicrobiales bacterium]